MIDIRKTAVFDDWLRDLRDVRARAKIQVRIRRLSLGNPGDVKPVGAGVSEMRIPEGKGYRVYYASHGDFVVILLCGGDKASQRADIASAKAIAQQLESADDA